MIKVGIIGATGYAGVELVRILLNHPQAEITALSSVSFEGQPISHIYPSLKELCDDVLTTAEDVVEKSDVVFAALPHGLSQQIAVQCDEKGSLFIDIGADFRLDDGEEYFKWYGEKYIEPELHKKAVYGLSEIFREQIKAAKIIGNPGCYPTSVALGLYPALKNDFIETENIIIDAKSGTTGAGRKLTQNTHFADLNETFAPYNIGKHRHTPEIEQTLSKVSGKKVSVTFTPHLLPINRGIVSTIYAKAKTDYMAIYDAYLDTYREEHFVRVRELDEVANLGSVRASNYCDISVHLDAHTNTLIVVSAIDNMVKGAAGQAVQNMNIALGLDETAGLNLIPLSF